MERLQNPDAYMNEVNVLRKSRELFTNNYLMQDDVNRLLQGGRFYQVRHEGGVTFLADEKKYYRAFLHTDYKKAYRLPGVGKPVLVQIDYLKDRKKDAQLAMEKWLKADGFALKDTAVQIKWNIDERRDECRKQFQRLEKMLEAMNFRLETVDYSYHEQVEALLRQQDMMRYYHFPYQAEAETKALYDSGNVTCILDNTDQVLAYHCITINGGCYGAEFVVRDEYKVKYSLAPILQYYRGSFLEYPVLKGYMLLDNAESIRLHERLGWEFTNRYTDNWLREDG